VRPSDYRLSVRRRAVLGIPDVSKDVAEFKAELKAIRQLLERLLEVEESRG
jgi:uncharacterized protein YlxP (DUF503 family)